MEGAIQVLRNAVGDGRVSDFPGKKSYGDVSFNVISVMMVASGCRISRKKHYMGHSC